MKVRLSCWEVGRAEGFQTVGLRLEAHVVVLGQQHCTRLTCFQVTLHSSLHLTIAAKGCLDVNNNDDSSFRTR